MKIAGFLHFFPGSWTDRAWECRRLPAVAQFLEDQAPGIRNPRKGEAAVEICLEILESIPYFQGEILGRLPKGAAASHYRTHAGAEVDLVIEQADGRTLAIEIKRTLSPKVTPGLGASMETLHAREHSGTVYSK